MSWNRERKADPALLVVQFSVCIVVWTVVVLVLTWLMIELDLVRSPEKL